MPVLHRRHRGARALRRALVPEPVAAAPRRPRRGGALLARPRRDAGTLPVEQVRRLVDLWAERTAALGARGDVAYVLVLENRGAEVGATIAHPHGQIYAFDEVPPVVRAELDHPAAARCATTPRGTGWSPSAGGWRAWVPHAASWPYGLSSRRTRTCPTFPRSRAPSPTSSPPCWWTSSVARPALRRPDAADVVVAPAAHRRRRLAVGPPARPRRPAAAGAGTPRYVAAAELGSGVFFNPVEPSAAAAALRGA